MSKVFLSMAEVIEISEYLDHLVDRLTEDPEHGVVIGPEEGSHLAAQLERCSGKLLRWNR
jgi:hypothetical protein